eukprot:TRINITY_DN2369_c0_g1_i5.p1 TRINITY_DN2369_c0_g1~~TRINITY_DN2369_c0_g1_i5.p1  ORF type:complete len:153 (+),score=7.38 TRINITY_DN2369_c0_g1_i5:38-496(+)
MLSGVTVCVALSARRRSTALVTGLFLLLSQPRVPQCRVSRTPPEEIVPVPVPTSCAAVSCIVGSTCKVHPVHGARCVKNDVVGCDQLRCAVCEEEFDGTGVCKPVEEIVPAPVPTSCAAVSCYQDSTVFQGLHMQGAPRARRTLREERRCRV